MQLDDYKRIFEELRTDYSKVQERHDALRDYTSFFFDKEYANDPKMQDNVVTSAIRAFQNGFMNYLTNSSTDWFDFKVYDLKGVEIETYEAKKLTQDYKDIINNILNSSNYYQTKPEVYKNLGIHGLYTLAMFMDTERIVHFDTYKFGTYFIGENSYKEIDKFARPLKLTKSQARGMFDKIPQDIENEESETQMFDFNHLIIPNDNYEANSDEKMKRKFISIYYREEEIVKIEGYDFFPILCQRWSKESGSPYPSDSPGMQAFASVIRTNALTGSIDAAVERGVNPPYVAQGVDNPEIVRQPGGVTEVIDSGVQGQALPPGLHKIETGAVDIEHARAWRVEAKEEIANAFFAPFFQALYYDRDRKYKSAVEANLIAKEALQIIGGQVYSIQKMLEGTFRNLLLIMNKFGMTPETPPSLKGVASIKVAYTSQLHKAKESSKTGDLNILLEIVTATGQIDPNSIAVVDTEEFIRKYSKYLNIDASILRSEEDFKNIIAQKAQKEEEERQAMVNQQNAISTKQLAEAGGVSNGQ